MAVLPSEIAAEGGEKNIAAEHNDTAAGEKKHAERAARQGELSARKVSKGFKFVCANLLFFALIRGLQNLEAFRKGNELLLFASCKK